MEYRKLGDTGLEVSIIGYGASPLGNVFRKISVAEGQQSVFTAMDLGINFIDVSPYYGLTLAETVLGKALHQINREAYVLATKVGRYGDDEFDFSAERVTRSVDESLQRLNVDTVDIIQCHDIEFNSLDQIVEETIPALEKVREQGKARFIGITGLPLKIFTEVASRTQIDTILSYCRYNLYDTSLSGIIPSMTEKGIGVINASPLSMGLLTLRGTPDWHPAGEELKQVCQKAANHCIRDGVDIAKLAMQYAVANDSIATTLVGTASSEHLRRNVSAILEPIDEELLKEVQEILKPVKDQTWPSGLPENN